MLRRIFYSDNGTLTDLSINLQNYHAGTNAFTLVAAQDCLYIGARLPFNHLYIKMDGDNVNAESSVMSASYWDGGNWRSVAELIDETASSGATLAQSGFITWITAKNYFWAREDTNYSGNSITGLTDLEIYDLYWLKLSFSADLTADTAIAWLGQKFSDDNDLGSEYSDLVRDGLISAFESGKTDWEEQHVRAAEIIVNDLTSKNIILEKEQILERFDFRLCAVSKVAELIYIGLGQNHVEDAAKAKKEYEKRLNSAMPRIDQNKNAREDIGERFSQGRLIR